ncbi:energy transducer TonB, partial [Limnofasciculus baicalensis]
PIPHSPFMSYITLITTLIEKLNQPTAIAVMASAGIHAALGLTLPHTSVFSSGKSQLPQPVQLLSLTPEDQSRIPEFVVSPAPPTIYEQTPIQSAFPPLDRLPTPKIPAKVSAKVPQTPVKKQSPAKFQIGKKLPKSNLKTNPGTLKNPVLNKPYNIANVNGIGIVNPPKNNIRIPVTPRPYGIPVLDSRPKVKDLFNFDDQDILPTPPITNPTLTVPPGKDPKQVIISRSQQIRDLSSTIAISSSNRTDGEGKINLHNFLSLYDKKQADGTITIPGNYPKEACAKAPKGSTFIGIEVGADGKPTSEKLVTKSSGDPILDRQAEQDVLSHGFNNQTGKLQIYLVSVTFDYNENICQAINSTTPPVANPTKPEVPTPTPSPSPTGNKPEVSIPTPSPSPTGNKPEVPTTTPSPSPTGNKPEVPTTIPSPEATGNKPGDSTTTPSPSPTGNKPEVPTTIPSPEATGNKPGDSTPTPSPQPTRIKPADPVPTISPQPQASQSTVP